MSQVSVIPASQVIHVVPKRRTKFKKALLCIRICRCIVRFFRALFCCCRPNLRLSDREKKLLATYVKYRTLPHHKKKAVASTDQHLEPVKEEEETPQSIEPSRKRAQGSAARQHVVQFARDYTNIFADVIYEKEISPLTKQFKSSVSSVSTHIKSFFSTFAPAIGKGTQLIFDLTQHRRRSALNPSLRTLLKWLLKDQDLGQLQKAIIDRLASQNIAPSQGKDIEEYVEPVIKWLTSFEKNPEGPQMPFAEVLNPHDFDSEVSETIQGTIFTLLMDAKIEAVIVNINDVLQDRLSEIVQVMISNNTAIITEFLAHRIIDLLEKVSFKDNVDKIIELFKNQVNDMLTAEKTSNEVFSKTKQMIEKASKTGSLPADLSVVAGDIKALGEEECKRKLLFAAYSEQPSCHKRLRQYISQLRHQPIDLAKFDKILKRSFFPDLASTIVELILPGEKRTLSNGTVQQVDGITLLWEQIVLPDEFKELIEQMKEATKEIFLPNIVKAMDELKNPILESIERHAVSEIQFRIKQALAKVLQEQIEKIVNPEHLNETMANSILPSLHHVLLYTYVCKIIVANAGSLAEPFKKALLDPAQRDAQSEKIKKSVLDMTCRDFREFSLPSRDDLSKMISPLIDDLSGYIAHGHAQKIPGLNEEKLKLILKQYFIDEDEGQEDESAHKLYGDLFDTLVFKLGRFGKYAEWAFGFKRIKRLITSGLLPGFEMARSSYETIAVKVCDALRVNYLDRQVAEDLIYAPPPAPVPTASTDQKLKDSLDSVSRLTYDLIVHVCSQEKGRFATAILRKFIGATSSDVSALIGKIYKETLGRHALPNYNLIFHIHDTVIPSLQAAAKEIQEEDPLSSRRFVQTEADGDEE